MIRKRARLAAAMAGLFFGASGSAAEAGATIITFDPPQSVYTGVSGINDQGTVVGYFTDTSEHEHGFVRTPDGTITTMDYPHSTATEVLGINDKGTIVGTYTNPDDLQRCFLKAADGKLRKFTIPGALWCHAESVNKADVIAGSYGGGAAGFVWDKGVVATFGVGNDATYPVQVNDAGVVTGWYQESRTHFGGFVRAVDGTVSTFDVPNAVRTEPASINAAGEITGGYVTKRASGAFVRTADGTITTFRYGVAVTATAINKQGQISGEFVNKAGTTIGFIRSSDGGVVKKYQIVGSDSIFAAGMNDHGEVAGFYIDSASHGFVRTR